MALMKLEKLGRLGWKSDDEDFLERQMENKTFLKQAQLTLEDVRRKY